MLTCNAFLASESLALIFQFPRYMVPGIKPSLSGEVKEDWEKDYDDTVAAYKILTSRPRWRARILSVFQRPDDEKWEDVQKYVEYLPHLSPCLMHPNCLAANLTCRE